MKVEIVFFECGVAPTLWCERGAFGVADGFAVDLPPFRDGVQDVAVFGGKGAVAFRSDV